MNIRLAMLLPPVPDRRWRLAAQAGVTRAVGKVGLAYRPWETASLAEAIAAYRAGGFELAGLEGDQFDMSRIKLGLPGRDEDIERYRRMLAAMGKLGIRLLCYNFMAGIGWFRSRADVPARGGALTSRFSRGDVPEEPLKFAHEKLWENYAYFIRAVAPAAAEAGVRLALHPDDPPVPELKGYPRIFTSAEAYRRALKLADSPAAAVTFCCATFKAMGEDVFKLLAEWRGRIAFVHLRNNRPLGDGFVETFHDEAPDFISAVLRELVRLDMDVLLRPDHAPTMDGEANAEPGYAALGRIMGIEYIKGALDAIRAR